MSFEARDSARFSDDHFGIKTVQRHGDFFVAGCAELKGKRTGQNYSGRFLVHCYAPPKMRSSYSGLFDGQIDFKPIVPKRRSVVNSVFKSVVGGVRNQVEFDPDRATIGF